MRNIASKLIAAAIVSGFSACGAVFGEAYGQTKPMPFKMPKDVDVLVPWLTIIWMILSLAILCTCAFKKARRTHID